MSRTVVIGSTVRLRRKTFSLNSLRLSRKRLVHTYVLYGVCINILCAQVSRQYIHVFDTSSLHSYVHTYIHTCMPVCVCVCVCTYVYDNCACVHVSMYNMVIGTYMCMYKS